MRRICCIGSATLNVGNSTDYHLHRCTTSRLPFLSLLSLVPIFHSVFYRFLIAGVGRGVLSSAFEFFREMFLVDGVPGKLPAPRSFGLGIEQLKGGTALLGVDSCPLYRAVNLVKRLSTPKALDLLDRVSLSTLKCDQEAGSLNYSHLLYQRFPAFLN